jgi:hypothetical protein
VGELELRSILADEIAGVRSLPHAMEWNRRKEGTVLAAMDVLGGDRSCPCRWRQRRCGGAEEEP